VILVDTSIWIDHLRQSDAHLVTALQTGQVLVHPFIVGELACGNLGNRQAVLSLLRAMPQAPVASDDEVLLYIETQKLMGRGIGYLGTHLLASAALAGASLWTRDKRLAKFAQGLALAYGGAP
jgi:predicted nucleic acid-binding protein